MTTGHAHPWQFIKVHFLTMDANWLGSGDILYELNVTDIRRFIEWTESHHPEIEIQARYQKMENCERKELVYNGIHPRRPIVKDYISVVAPPEAMMLFKLSCPFPAR